MAIECVIDTGFAGFLTLPIDAILALNLPFIRRMPVNLADNSTIFVEVFAATILWKVGELELEVLATRMRPLLGTLLLEGCELNIRCTEGDVVEIGNL